MSPRVHFPTSLPARRRLVAVSAAAVVIAATGVAASIWLAHHDSDSAAPRNTLLAKVHAVRHQFPPGYEVTETEPKVITQKYLDDLRTPMDGATYIPAECAEQSNSGTLLPVGATIEGLRGRFNDRTITVAAMETPEPVSPRPVLPQCAAVAFVKPGYIHGFLSHPGAPGMPTGDTDTQALRMSATLTDQNKQDTDIVQYAYVATLDDRHLVSVTITGTPLIGQPHDIDPAPAQHLLDEAVRVLRR